MAIIANATTLRATPQFRDWVETACVIKARSVVESDATDSNIPAEDKPVRLKLAVDTLVTANVAGNYMVGAVSCDPDVATTAPVFNNAMEVSIQNTVNELWTLVARIVYPNDPEVVGG